MKILKFLLLLIFPHACIVGQINWLDSFNFWKKRKAVQAYQVQDYDRALVLLDNLIAQDPYNPEYNYNIGDIFYKQKRYQDAHYAFSRAVENAVPSSKLQEQSLFNAGNSLYQLEAWLKAIEAFQQVLKINENNRDAEHNLQLALYKLEEQRMQNEQKKEENKQDEQIKSDSDTDESQDQNSCSQNSQNSSNDLQNSNHNKSGQEKSDQGSADQEKKSGQDNQKEKNNNFDQGVKSDQEQGDQDKDSGDTQKSDKQSGQQELNKNKDFENKNFGEDEVDDVDHEQLTDKPRQDNGENSSDQSDQIDKQQVDVDKIDNNQQEQDQKEATRGYKKPELKNELKDEYESKASDDDRLTDYHASVMKTLEELEEKIQKHFIKHKVAMQGAGQHGKKGW